MFFSFFVAPPILFFLIVGFIVGPVVGIISIEPNDSNESLDTIEFDFEPGIAHNPVGCGDVERLLTDLVVFLVLVFGVVFNL